MSYYDPDLFADMEIQDLKSRLDEQQRKNHALEVEVCELVKERMKLRLNELSADEAEAKCAEGAAMTTLDAFLADWRAKSAAATAGPWEPRVAEKVDPGYYHGRHGAGPEHADHWERGENGKYVSCEPLAEADADFIAHARNHGDRLVAIVEAARGMLDAIHSEAANAVNWHETKGMKVAQSPRIPLSLALRLRREIGDALAELDRLSCAR